MKKVKGVKYKMMVGDQTAGGEHIRVYRCSIIKLYT